MVDFQTLCVAKKVVLILKRSLFRIGSNQLSLFYLVGVLVMQQQSHRIMHLIEHFNVSGLNHFLLCNRRPWPPTIFFRELWLWSCFSSALLLSVGKNAMLKKYQNVSSNCLNFRAKTIFENFYPHCIMSCKMNFSSKVT